ncbi:MAG TPA: 4Fe-4S binding protein [Clostridiaceae bacterium]|nr:4Fe-4S binding protein [Clostridiaceae bacterium]
MVFYFSGTGNSSFVAKCIATSIEDELISINEVIKEGREAVYHSPNCPLVFVTPTYCWRIPRVVEQFIRETEFVSNKKAYFILTCGSETGNAVKYVRKLCQDKGFKLQGFADLIMPENYTALFTCPEPQEATAIVARAYNNLQILIEYIRQDQAFPLYRAKKKFLSYLTPPYYALIVKAKKIRVSEDCVACGKCVEVCPLDNVIMTDANNKIFFGDNCTHCMACINTCPTYAIDYGRRTKGKHRYLFSRDIDTDTVIKKK